MTARSTIAIDVMSGDGGIDVVLDAVQMIARRQSDVSLLLVGDQSALESRLDRHALAKDRVRIVPAADVVTMDDTAAAALRNKKRSSMRIAVDLVKSGQADACVSAGNTGALMAIGKFVLKTVPGIDRPAICTTIPAIDGHTHMLDLGANVDCTAEHLYQFATMGAIFAEAVDGIDRPRVGLLNIGAEAIKGNEQVKQAAQLLKASTLNYHGFVEANEIYTGKVDVVVCDGFVGNVSLKTSEGVARMISHYLRQEFTRSAANRMIGLLARPVLQAFSGRIDPRRYNGASLLGLKGVIIKSHGSADALAFANALDIARVEIEQNVPSKIALRLATTASVA